MKIHCLKMVKIIWTQKKGCVKMVHLKDGIQILNMNKVKNNVQLESHQAL